MDFNNKNDWNQWFKNNFKTGGSSSTKGPNFNAGTSGSGLNFKNPFYKIKLPKKAMIASIFILALVLFYFLLPPINLHSMEFWVYFFIVGLYGGLVLAVTNKWGKKIFTALGLIFLIVFALNLSSSEILHAKRYAQIINPVEGDFSEEISEIPYDRIPTVDKDTAQRLGSREMGELLEIVSQFNIENTFTQINFQGDPIRVSPLEYNGLLKWLTNFRQGIPNFMTVGMIDGKADLKKIEPNIKYSKSDLFFRDAYRQIRISHPTRITGELSFEIDEEGVPYWITPVYKNRISWFGAMDVNGAIILNAQNGHSDYYDLEDIPVWVDRIFPASDVIRQLEWNGKYQSGFFNSIFAQSGVLKPTEGYNYLALEDDVFLYTGITSVAADESNVGFVLINLRTKETKFYPVSSANEVSAMASAEGEVQEKGYRSTFPILLNIQGKPTYFMSLKDNAGLIKSYAFVDAQDYQEVAIGSSVELAYKNHTGSQLVELDEDINPEDIKSESGLVEDITQVVVGGESKYYFTLEGKEGIYSGQISLSPQLAFLEAGDEISFSYIEENGLRTLVTLD